MDLKKNYQFNVSIEISLDLELSFSLVTYQVDNVVALCSTNQIAEISAQW